MNIRKATLNDLEDITALESLCFPETEAATKESFEWRLQTYPQHFLVMEMDNKIISFVNGPVTIEADLIDEMYDSPKFCNDQGKWQMIFGVVTNPDYQRQGYASAVMRRFIEEARSENRKGVVLTCKESKIPFYSSFGFKDEGLSVSNHGGVPWHQMRLTFESQNLSDYEKFCQQQLTQMEDEMDERCFGEMAEGQFVRSH